ncbi:MAG: cation transporter, partial [Oscillospiraceae bacterium]|nr:cation transporter [Oscillospiraceae bacterium]
MERKLLRTDGVHSATVSYRSGVAVIVYDHDITTMEQITAVVRKLGYDAPAGELSPGERVARTAAILAGIIALFAAFQGLGLLNVL